MNSFGFHLNGGASVGLVLGEGAGQIAYPYFLVANMMAQVVKTNDMVKPGIEYPAPRPANMSPNRCENASKTTTVAAAPTMDMTNVVLFDFTNGPDQKAIPVRTELNPNRPNVTEPAGAPRM